MTPGPFELTWAQVKQENDIRVLCGGWPRHSVEPLAGVRVRRLPSALPRLSLFPTTAVTAWAWTIAWRKWADVVHGHGHLPVWYHVSRRRIADPKPYVLHLHVTAAGREAIAKSRRLPMDSWTRAWEWPLHKLSDRLGCRVADAVICVSESVKEEAVRFCGADPKKLYVISNGVDTSHFTPVGGTAHGEYGFESTDYVVLFVGVLSQRKRPDLLVDALGELPPGWKLLVVGRGPLESQLYSRVQELGLMKRVVFAGYVPYPELPSLYRTADVVALLSEYEGFPKVILEALACGVPVVITPSFQPDEAIQPWLTYPKEITPQEVAMALERAVSEVHVDTASFGSNYDWSIKAEIVSKVYREVIERCS